MTLEELATFPFDFYAAGNGTGNRNYYGSSAGHIMLRIDADSVYVIIGRSLLGDLVYRNHAKLKAEATKVILARIKMET